MDKHIGKAFKKMKEDGTIPTLAKKPKKNETAQGKPAAKWTKHVAPDRALPKAAKGRGTFGKDDEGEVPP